MRTYVAAGFCCLGLYAACSPTVTSRAHAADPVSECAPGVLVTASTLASTIRATGCQTLVLAAGLYPKLNIASHSGGVLAIRCKEPATCVLGTNSVVTNVDGFILDGVQIRGGSNGLTIKASKNVLVQRSKFIEQVGSGITLYPGTTNENIQIYNNEFRNAVLGCDPNNHENCFYLSDGSPIAEMDYGLRIYSVASMDIKGNQFGTVFNHAISLKANVLFAYMTRNTFNACGRTCIELGQNTTGECGEALVDGNVFKGSRLLDVHISNIKKATVTNNIFYTAKSKIRIDPRTPEDRVIVTSPNTFQ
jgi:hypothetical protein